jgi:FBP C-terminal treble-clef zinc-finger
VEQPRRGAVSQERHEGREWRDHQAPERAYLAADLDGTLVALVLRSSVPSALHRVTNMCSLCLTAHTGGVSLLVAPRTGKAGQQGNTVGAYICSYLAPCTRRR